MNKVQRGYYRDKEIVREIEARGALNTEQIACLLFSGSAALTKCQQRMKKLHDAKRVKRTKIDGTGSYCYFTGKKPGQLEHLISTNWVYIWLIKKLKSWESLWYWQYEMVYDILRCDAFAGIRNNFTQEAKFYFIELDRSNNTWDKTVKYNQLYETEKYAGSSWVEHTKVFPIVLCVTENKNRLAVIEQSVRDENKYGLRFEVRLLEDLIKEVVACKG
ncbi:MAG: hypothetical protein HPY70_14900 [Firmicutes bacterium]|nr:hypothetical protein [Bacillota bacterium]